MKKFKLMYDFQGTEITCFFACEDKETAIRKLQKHMDEECNVIVLEKDITVEETTVEETVEILTKGLKEKKIEKEEIKNDLH